MHTLTCIYKIHKDIKRQSNIETVTMGEVIRESEQCERDTESNREKETAKQTDRDRDIKSASYLRDP